MGGPPPPPYIYREGPGPQGGEALERPAGRPENPKGFQAARSSRTGISGPEGLPGAGVVAPRCPPARFSLLVDPKVPHFGTPFGTPSRPCNSHYSLL